MGAPTIRNTLLGFASGLGAIAFPAAGLAQNSQTFVDLSGSAGYSSNPSLADSGDSSAFGRVSANAVHSMIGERGDTSLSGFVEHATYSGDYGSTQIFDLGARTRYQVSELVTLFGRLNFSGDSGGQLYTRFNDVPTTQPSPSSTSTLAAAPPPSLGAAPALTPVDPFPDPFFDPTILDFNRRQYRLSGQAGAAITVSARDSISVSGGARRVFFGSNGNDLNYTVLDGSVGWQHQISELTSAGAQMGVQRANYSGPQNHSTIYNPRLTYQTQIAQYWDVSLAGGVSIAHRRTEEGSDRSVSPAADASLCRNGVDERYCGRVSHSVQSDVGQTARKTTGVGVDYYNRISTKDTLQARASFTRYSGADSITDLARATYYTAGMSYGRSLNDRMSTGVDAGLRKINREGEGSFPADVSLSAFLRYRLGDIR